MIFDVTVTEISCVADYDVCFCRVMSELADVDTQPCVGMFTKYFTVQPVLCMQSVC